ncbi:MAG TPA: YkgJ family cysteine cluster protein [Planctomycetota bacterium]|nr:YkgJ family cysteine cluster protein [Planctomycetota bacterium]HRU51901.1 YkgJ family cysteine cluster protein [Planctomycetota bacterium]
MKKFQCLQCGRCCRGEGYVWLDQKEIEDIAQYLSMPLTRFQEQYVKETADGPRLKDNLEGDCIFYQNGCRIYAVRPEQCRTFPYWDHMSPEDMQYMLQNCAGFQYMQKNNLLEE